LFRKVLLTCLPFHWNKGTGQIRNKYTISNESSFILSINCMYIGYIIAQNVSFFKHYKNWLISLLNSWQHSGVRRNGQYLYNFIHTQLIVNTLIYLINIIIDKQNQGDALYGTPNFKLWTSLLGWVCHRKESPFLFP
jgi:hypothetical protein